jgi:Xaa-Pro aminopeptidase
VDALVVSSPANVRYLTGFAGSNGLVLITPLESHFFTDPRYATDASATIDCRVHVARKTLFDAAVPLLKRKRLKKIGFEEGLVTVEQFDRVKKALGANFTLHPTGGLVESFRSVKSPAEIELIRESVNVNSDAYYRTMRRVKLGVRECDIAAELDFQMRMLGAEKPAFDTIVAAGARSALPHAHPSIKRVEPNELLLVDMGAILQGYCSDMTRMAFMGTPTRRVRAMYRAVLDAQLAAIDEVRAGVATAKVDGAARKVLKTHGLDRAFVHSTGHGLGLEIHELPRVAGRDKSHLQAGMVITIEPGVYLEDFGGIRIEDTVLVTEQGCEVLTPTTKELVHL